MTFLRVVLVAFLCFWLGGLARGETSMDRFSLEGEFGPTWQTRNEFAIPPAGGTRLNLADFDKGAFLSYRFYGTWRIHDRHALRLLIAPLVVRTAFTAPGAIRFHGIAINSGERVEARYKFNSYRLTYQYFFPSESAWSFRLGFTAKVRDAAIGLTAPTASADYTNVGFVPLLHGGVAFKLSDTMSLDFDFDAAAAPQGRAEDLSLKWLYRFLPGWQLSIGYRTVEGGADNEKVFTFAWLHSIAMGVTWSFGA